MVDYEPCSKMAFDELVVNGGSLNLPGVLQDIQASLAQFSNLCHAACLTMLNGISESLHAQGAEGLEMHHRHGHPSDSGLKLIYEPSLARVVDVKENRHTDSGTLTMLFYEEWGLHVNLKGSDEWAFASVTRGSVLVNVANSLQRLSGGTFHSPIHRVTQPGDGFSKRYYLSYFLRPEDELKAEWARTS
jgi:isopenicillin N synthase-like dioxygenase